MTTFINQTNKKRENNNKLPNAIINIANMPLREDIEKVLETVAKIKILKLNFFPLNNAINPIPGLEALSKLRKNVGSKTANVIFNSPQSKENTAEVIIKSTGLANPSLTVKYKNGGEGTIRPDSFNTNVKIKFSRDIDSQDDDSLVDIVKDNEHFNKTSEENITLYKKFTNLFKNLLKE